MKAVCIYCDTPYRVPNGWKAFTERTCDTPPPAKVAVFAWKKDGRPLVFNDPNNMPKILHECHHGIAVKRIKLRRSDALA